MNPSFLEVSAKDRAKDATKYVMKMLRTLSSLTIFMHLIIIN